MQLKDSTTLHAMPTSNITQQRLWVYPALGRQLTTPVHRTASKPTNTSYSPEPVLNTTLLSYMCMLLALQLAGQDAPSSLLVTDSRQVRATGQTWQVKDA
jgi:hypothetical protein